MIGIFLKELRENLKWAGVIFGILMVLFIHETRSASPDFLFLFSQKYTMVIAPLAGLLMGVVQTLFDTRPDNWAFTVHRPVPRLQIFIAKCAAGLLLLYASLILPCLIAAIWASRPGNIAMPFQSRMTLPMFADDLNSGCYYFVGMLLTLRRARWHGGRILPIAMALLSSAAITMFIAHFWQAAIAILIVQSLGALAAWGAFATNGECSAAPITRFALGAFIWPGAFGLGMIVFGLSGAFNSGGQWHYYQVDNKGLPVLVTQRIERGERSFAITDLAGQPLPQYQNIDLDDPANTNLFLRFNGALGDQGALPWPANVLYGSDSYRSIIPGVIRLNSVAPPNVRLRFAALYNIHDRIIQLYDPITTMPIGTVGPDGFAAAHEPPRTLFPANPLNIAVQSRSHVLTFDSVVYRIEMDQRRVRPIFTASADDPIFSATEVGPDSDPTIIIATSRQLHVFHTSGDPIFSAPLPVDPTKHYLVAAVIPGNHHLVFDCGTFPGIDSWQRQILEYSTDGTLVHTTDLPRLPEFRGPKLIETAGFGLMYPIALRPILPTWILDEVLDIRSEDFSTVFETFMISSAILSAALTILLSRRCGFTLPKTIAWSIGNLLLGPAGVIVMLSITHWPAREQCAHCGHHRLTTQSTCPHCDSPLPPPSFDGREIFEPADTFQPAM